MSCPYRTLISSTFVWLIAATPSYSANSWETKDGYFSATDAYHGHPPDVLGPSMLSPSILNQDRTAEIWQTREITNAAVIAPDGDQPQINSSVWTIPAGSMPGMNIPIWNMIERQKPPIIFLH